MTKWNMPKDDPKGGENKIINLLKSGNEIVPSMDIQCCCGRGFTHIKGMRIHHTEIGCQRHQRRKSVYEIIK